MDHIRNEADGGGLLLQGRERLHDFAGVRKPADGMALAEAAAAKTTNTTACAWP